ncbi:hypothetical protein POHY109586_24350 [Polaromonas hydrogenivorans]
MSKIRHTLQLLHSGNLNTRQIGAALGISKFTVSDIASYTRAAGLDWNEAQHLNEEELQARLSPVISDGADWLANAMPTSTGRRGMSGSIFKAWMKTEAT